MSHQLDSHYWSDGNDYHGIRQDGVTINHRRCDRCGRDFGKGFNGDRWEAAYVGILRIERLARSVTQRWLSEPCPGEVRREDDELRAMRAA